MYVNNTAPREVLSPEDLGVIEQGWQHLLSEIGIQFHHPEALERLHGAGQRVEGDIVYFDPEWVLKQAAKAPSEFVLRARNPEKSVVLGGRHMVFAPTSGPPFFRIGDERREARLSDFELMAKLVHTYDELDLTTMPMVETDDVPLDSRHLDMLLKAMVTTDKVVTASGLSETNALDGLEMARIMMRGAPIYEPDDGHGRPMCSIQTIVNANSPLMYDSRMLESMLVFAEAGQAVTVTPFLLMGAMSPVTIPSALAQQTAEALAGIALIQTVREGCPVIMGSFLSSIDMQSGSPSFGGPESAKGLAASGQLARRYGLPWRAGGGGLTASQSVDAQAGYEAFNTLNAAFDAGANLVVQSAGWLESGLVSCPEKLVMDVEILRMLRVQFTPLEVDEESLAFAAHDEVRHGGHFLGAMHTLERFRDCFYRPMLSSTENFERWTSRGSRDAAARAGDVWRAAVDAYTPPDMDADLHAELTAYVDRRRAELGD